jgi:hypothetical protein
MLDYPKSITLKSVIEAHQRQGERDITDRMISEFRVQHVQIKAHRFTCASYNPFEALHLDHIGPLTRDAHGNEYILVIIDAFSRWVELFQHQVDDCCRNELVTELIVKGWSLIGMIEYHGSCFCSSRRLGVGKILPIWRMHR